MGTFLDRIVILHGGQSMTAIAFALTALENGRRVGHAVICADARYVTVQLAAADRPERRFVPAQDWKALDRAVSDTLEPGPLPADGAISSALLPPDRRRSTVVQYLYAEALVDGPDVAVRLDALLRGLAVPAQPRPFVGRQRIAVALL